MGDITKFPPLTPEELAENQSASIIAGNLVVAILATIAVGLRFTARWIQGRLFGIDDYLTLLALPFGWGMCIGTIISTENGLGQHMRAVLAEDKTGEMLVRMLQAYFSTELAWVVSVMLVKLSILCLYNRIFERLRWMRISAIAMGTFTIAWAIAVFIAICLQCQPIAHIWDQGVPGSCFKSWDFFVASSAPNAFADVILLLMPLPAVWSLRLSRVQRISLTGIFVLGSLTCIFSIVRLVTVIKDNNDPDATWATGIVSIWSTAEPCLGIVTTSLATLRPLFSRCIGPLRGSTRDKYSTSITTKSRRAHLDTQPDWPLPAPKRVWGEGSEQDVEFQPLGAYAGSRAESNDTHSTYAPNPGHTGGHTGGIIQVETTWETRSEQLH